MSDGLATALGANHFDRAQSANNEGDQADLISMDAAS
jgi:hypothetical protein